MTTTKPSAPTIEDVFQHVATRKGYDSVEALVRGRPINQYARFALWLCKEYLGASTRDIARASGLSKSAVAEHLRDEYASRQSLDYCHSLNADEDAFAEAFPADEDEDPATL